MAYYSSKNADLSYSRGEIHYIEGMGHLNEFGFRSGRPGIIISDNTTNSHSMFVTIVPLTTQPQQPSPTNVDVQCKAPSTALCGNIQTVAKGQIGDYIRTCSHDEMLKIDSGVCYALGLSGSSEKQNHGGYISVEEVIAIRAELDIYKKLYSQIVTRVTKIFRKLILESN